ncbi:MAG: dolichyl-phosphate beta-glucosyltransferase [Chrysothrix sp. TS-e1954]|nr:MAG: dolichyl-phosphate beta-glucosyltransferase [Chrysothrix sp. TS-e1954]
MSSLDEMLATASSFTWYTWVTVTLSTILVFAILLYTTIAAVAPFPRPPLAYETTFQTVDEHGDTTDPQHLPCWHDVYLSRKSVGQHLDEKTGQPLLEPPEVFISVVIPAYNEENRLKTMLEEAVTHLEATYGPSTSHANSQATTHQNGSADSGARKRNNPSSQTNGSTRSHTSTLAASASQPSGWEILIISDGSTDATISTALDFSKAHPKTRNRIRVISLLENRGKGGAVTHGMRHVRGLYTLFADADGASRFSCLASLVTAAETSSDTSARCVAIGSRSHLVSTPSVIKRSWLRNFLMHSFHLLLRLMTPPATSRIKDTQCGFKLFSRAALPYIIPHMHSEGWIFDVEMLMLAEMAGVPMVEVPVEWHEVGGSKLSVVWDSLGMAWGLAVLRGAWALGVYRT